MLNQVNFLTCNSVSDGDVVNYDLVFSNSLNALRSGSFDERKIVFMSFCEAEDDDNTCERQDGNDHDNESEVIVVNAGIIDHHYHLSNIRIGPVHYFNFPSIDKDTLLPGVDDIESEVCEEPTPFPTARPTPPTSDPSSNPTPQPSARPTPRPTDKPTGNPTPNPTPRPTNRPTFNPSPSPTHQPTPRPTQEPTPKPTFNVCEQISLVIVV